MSQRAVEAVLGRMITDLEFRGRFFAEPAKVCGENEIVLTAREIAALLLVDQQLLNRLAGDLDPKIVRAASLTQLHSGDLGGERRSGVFARPGTASDIRRG